MKTVRFTALVLFFLGILPAIAASQISTDVFFRKGGKESKVKVIWDKKVGLTTNNIAEGRDMTVYDDGGHFDCGQKFGASMGDGGLEKCDGARIRDFVWNHWQNKAKGYIVITGNSVDAVSTSHIFIEPGKGQKWHVAWRIVRHFGEIDDMPDIIKVERAKSIKETDPDILIFRDREGDQVKTLPWR